MFSCRDERDCQRLVTFYVIYTIIYSSCILLSLCWSAEIYTVGKYNFHTTLLIIAFAEIVKYFSSVVYIMKNDYNLFKKTENVSLVTILKGLFTISKVKEGWKTVIVVLGMMAVYFTISVLYGAEIFKKHEETFMFSSLLSILTVLPACINLGSYSLISVLMRCMPNDILEQLLYQNIYVTIIGAWIGAIVIPLDWDRPWQIWPIPCSVGALVGFLVSHILMVFNLKETKWK